LLFGGGDERIAVAMRIASYNVENMFRRPKALDPRRRKENASILATYSRLTQLLEQDSYAEDRAEILKLLKELGLERGDTGEFAVLRKIRGQLLKRPRSDRPVEVVADGRGDWIGWVELKKEAVDAEATKNTARVVADLGADVLAVVEAEDRMALLRFNEYVLKQVVEDEHGAGSALFRHVMLVDGNDERGIDVGLLTRDGFPIGEIHSHVDDEQGGKLVFSRDCAEYEIATPDGGSLLLMINHFKSKGYASKGETPAEKRRRQASRVAEIYEQRRSEGWDRIVIAGDLNDTPDSDPLEPLVADTDLTDAGAHDDFEWGERTGTYEGGKDQIDYLLLSPALDELYDGGGVSREGIWHGPRVKNPWTMLPTLEKPEQAASDHAAIWVDLKI
jgi:endonuclease/exonuclease/phosphatase family metal-dependent hydrolase